MPHGTDAQPIAAVHWIPRDVLIANTYNPNHVAPPELELLRTSILEDGWTQPLVVRRSTLEIIDGFHRWMISADADIAAMTDGLVPVVYLDVVENDRSHQMMSTIRHNRARGSHYVLRMADIVTDLLNDPNVTDADLITRLGMEREEIKRLQERGDMRQRGSAETFNAGWKPSRNGK